MRFRTSLVDHAWAKIVGTTRVANSSNSTKVKLVEDLKRCGVAHIVVKMSWTPTLASTDCPTPSSISCDVKKLWESQAIAMQWKITILSSSISSNYFFITWGRGEMIGIRRGMISRRGNMALTWGRHLWSQMRMKRKKLGKRSSLYSPCENPRLHGWILHFT